jgi:hypothetical protein
MAKELVVDSGKVYERKELSEAALEEKIAELEARIASLQAKKADLEAKKDEAYGE